MDRAADNMIDVTWVAWCAERLREQWPRLDGATLEETARELWEDETLRRLGPRQAAAKWLALGMPESLQTRASKLVSGQGSEPGQVRHSPAEAEAARRTRSA